MSDYLLQLEATVETFAVTGASFAYWDATKLHLVATGVRNSVTRDPLTVDTAMHIGSITKLLNTALMLQLVDEGKLALEDPITKFLPELRLRDEAALRRITCAMLLNHSSGIDGDMLADQGPDRERIEDAIARCAELGQVHPPGAAASYCNMGMVIAGYLIQKLRSTSWFNLVRDRIFEPLGMDHALADLTQLPRFRHSIGDLTDPITGKGVQTTRPFLPLSFAPAGTTVMMTAADLVTFGRTLINGGVGPNGVRILSAASAARMAQPTTELAMPPVQIGLGWMLAPGGVLTHGGTVAGGTARLYAHPASGRLVVFLMNCDRKHAVAAFLNPIVESWTGIDPGARLSSTQAVPIQPNLYAGIYENQLMRAEVFSEERGLAFRMIFKVPILDNLTAEKNALPVLLNPLGNETFEGPSPLSDLPNLQLRFVKLGADGRAQFLAIDGRLLPRRY